METMYGYICEESAQCRENIEHSKELVQKAVDLFKQKDYQRILIIASGSSYNGACGGKYYIEKVLKIKCDVITSFTFTHYEERYGAETFVFGAGQSGRSVNTNDALEKARKMGMTVVGLTGNVEAAMKEHTDEILNWGMGIEKIGYVTKGYTTLALYFMLFALEAAAITGKLSEKEALKYKAELLNACDCIDSMIEKATAWYHNNEEELTDLKRVQITGYGPAYSCALEGALKIAETTGHAATAYEMEEFLHGPSIETNPDHTVFILDSLGAPSERAYLMYQSVQFLTKRAFFITNRIIDDPRVLSVEHQLSEIAAPLIYAIPFQIISAFGKEKWVNPMTENREKMNAVMGSKLPKKGNETGL